MTDATEIAELRERIERLESQSSQADTSGFNVVQVTPAGLITFNFSGHIFATGLDLFASTSLSPPDDRKVRWLRQADNSPVSFLSGYEAGAGEGQDWRLLAQAGTAAFPGAAEIDLSSVSDAGTCSLGIALDATGFASLQANAIGVSSTILNSNKFSTFLQSAKTASKPLGVEGLSVVRGIVDTTGPSGSIVAGAGFTITRNGVGDITINFSTAFSAVPACVPTPSGGANLVCTIVSNAVGSVRFTRGTTAPAGADGVLHFYAIGPT